MPQHDETRGLLVRYLESLALAQQVTLKLLDFVQADAVPVTPEALRECRRFVGEALARIESSEAHAAQLWEVLEIERRVPGAPPASVGPRTAPGPKTHLKRCEVGT